MDKNLFQKFKVSIVALPLGNIEDLSPRSRRALENADFIFCEDTRKMAVLWGNLEIKKEAPRFCAHPGDSEKDVNFEDIFLDLAKQKLFNVCCVSDAGTPVVNDPGFSLIEFCYGKAVPLVALPGPSAPILAWQWGGGFGLPFYFAGFSPKAKSAKSKDYEKFFTPAAQNTVGTFCFFETKHQFETTLSFLLQSEKLKDRPLCVAREMTKTHEEIFKGHADSALKWFHKKQEELKGAFGELTILLDGGQNSQNKKSTGSFHGGADLLEICSIIRLGTPKEAAKAMSSLTGVDVQSCYKKIVDKKGS